MSEYNYDQHGGVKEQVRLILVSTDANANKFWNATLCKDDTIVVYNGRVGGTGQCRPVTTRGEHGLRKLAAEKDKKGYKPQRVLASAGAPVNIAMGKHSNVEILERAKKEMMGSSKPSTFLSEIIEFLVQANVHSITDSTSIKFDSVSGVFSTPLGVLTPDAIVDAKELLVQIHAGMCKGKIPVNLVNEYLQIVPQKVGAKLKVEDIFGTSDKINAQLKTLESLEESIKTLEKRKADASTEPVKEEEKSHLFPVTMDMEEDKKVIKAIHKFYDSTKNVRSSTRGYEIRQIFKLDLVNSRKEFEEKGVPIGNLQRYWHGTGAANLLSILQNGLKTAPPSTAKIAGKAFGNGIYFSDIATKSLGYATGYWSGGKSNRVFMLLNDVAMGKSYDPKQTDWNGKWPKDGTQSTFARGGGVFMNNEMIVYENYQVNPTHLVEFKG